VQTLSSQNSPKMAPHVQNDCTFIGKRVRWIQTWCQILKWSSNMVETALAQWEITKISKKQRQMTKMSTSYRKLMSVSPFCGEIFTTRNRINAFTAYVQTLLTQVAENGVVHLKWPSLYTKRVHWIQIWCQFLSRWQTNGKIGRYNQLILSVVCHRLYRHSQ